MGIIPPKMVTSVIAEDPTQRVQIVQNGPEGRVAEYVVAESETLKLILTGYDPQSGYFDVNVESHYADDDFDHMIRDAAFQAVLQLDPYLALLYDVNRRAVAGEDLGPARRSEEHTSELQSLMRHSYAVFCLKKKIKREGKRH